MGRTIAIISGNDEEYFCDYKIEEELEVDIYNCDVETEDNSSVTYKGILLKDLRNSQFYYSPVFYYTQETWSMASFQQFRSKFYFYTGKLENVDELNENIKIKSISFYNPMLIHYFSNSSLGIKRDGKHLTYSIVLKDADKKVIEINHNNIEKIEFGSVVSSKDRNNHQTVNIESENYIKLYLIDAIGYEDVLAYISEMDSFINAYYPTGLRSYETTVQTESGKAFRLYHKLLGKEKYYNKATHRPIKTNFFDYLETLYKKVNYRNTNNKNQYLLLDFKRPTSLEDQFIFYFRYIDMFIGQNRLTEEGTHPRRTHIRIKLFLDDYSYLFDDKDKNDLGKLKNELNSLRSHYVHEGYYFDNNQFTITNDDKTTYQKDMDYEWLYRITRALKLGAYIILYKEILGFEIDESELRISIH